MVVDMKIHPLQSYAAVNQVSGFTFMPVLLVVVCLLMGNDLHAQQKKESVVYLSNGSVVFGQLVEADSNGIIKVTNDCGIHFYKPEIVDSIRPSQKRSVGFAGHKGYFNYSSLALLFGEGRDGYLPVPSLTMVNGYQFNNRMLLGLGIGYEYYEFSVMPVFADITYVLGSDKVKPYASLRFGGGIPLQRSAGEHWSGEEQPTYGGVMIAPSVGVFFPMGKKDAFSLSLGYHHQELSFDGYDTFWQWPEPSLIEKRVFINYNRIELRAGFLFR